MAQTYKVCFRIEMRPTGSPLSFDSHQIYENIHFRRNLRYRLCVNQRFCSKLRHAAVGAPAQRFKSNAHADTGGAGDYYESAVAVADPDFNTATFGDADSKFAADRCADCAAAANSDAAPAADVLQAFELRANQKQNQRGEKTNAGASDTDRAHDGKFFDYRCDSNRILRLQN